MNDLAVQTAPDEQKQPARKPWQRIEGEPTLWWNRFVRYRDLGCKRSLQAAFEQERSTITALKSPKEEKPRAKKRAGVSSSKLTEVPKPLQVPGSWKKASVQWQWVERARAYDTNLVERTVQSHLADVLSQEALGIHRVMALKSLYTVTRDILNANSKNMSVEQINMLLARMQSMLKDIRDEMKEYDPAITHQMLTYEIAHMMVTKSQPG